MKTLIVAVLCAFSISAYGQATSGLPAPSVAASSITGSALPSSITSAPGLITPPSQVQQSFTAGTGGVTANTLVTISGTTASTAAVNAYGGVAANTATVGNNVQVVATGGAIVPVIFDGAAVAGDIAIPSATTPGQAHDSGATSTPAVAAGKAIVGLITSAASGAGQTGNVRLHGVGIFASAPTAASALTGNSLPATLTQAPGLNTVGPGALSNAALTIGSDSGTGERYAFSLHSNCNEFDTLVNASGTSTNSPACSLGTIAGTASDTAAVQGTADKALEVALPANSTWTIQAQINVNASMVGPCFGFDNLGAGVTFNPQGAVGTFGPNTTMVCINTTSLLYYDNSAFTTVTAYGNLTQGWNTVTLSYLGGGFVAISAEPDSNPGATQTWYFTSQTVPTGMQNVHTQVAGANDKIRNLRYSTDSAYATSLATLPRPLAGPAQPLPFVLTAQGGTLAMVPPNYNPAVPNRWVIYNHGAGQTAIAVYTTLTTNSVLQALLNAGYVVVGETNTVADCWGNAACGTDMSTLVAQMRTYLNLDAKPFVVAASMGGLTTLNAISHGQLSPRAVADLYPVYSLSSMYAAGSGTYASSIQTAYGFSGSANYAAATAGYDPALTSISSFTGVPFYVTCSAADTVVTCSSNGQALSSAITAAGGTSTFTASSGAHGDASNFNAAAIVSFFNKY